jgi:LEA14-like dessication related protein
MKVTEHAIRLGLVRLAPLAAAIAILLSGAGCVTFHRPDVAFRTVELRSFGSDGAHLDAAFDVTNPNSYDIGVEQLTYRLTVNGREAGGGTIESATPLPAHETTLLWLPLSLDWTKIKTAGLDILFLQGVEYAVDGDITFSTPVGTFHRPYRHTGRYAPFEHSHWYAPFDHSH